MSRPRLLAASVAALAAVLVTGVLLVQRAQQSDALSASTNAQVDWLGEVANMAQGGFERPTTTLPVTFPQDHAVHPATPSELWQMSAHLTGLEGAQINVQFSLTRIGLVPPDTREGDSIWELRDLYRAHLITTDSTGAHSIAEERFGRGLAGLAGFDDAAQELHFDNWVIAFPNDSQTGIWQFRATAGDVSIALELTPEKPPLRVNADDTPFQGYAFSRLGVKGTLGTQGNTDSVAGHAWFDHAWGELPLPGAGPVISDRLLLQLDTGHDVSIVVSQRRDGRGTPSVDAFVIDRDGEISPLGGDVAQVEFPRMWQGAHVQWPVAWSIRLDDVLTLEVSAVNDAQEHSFTPALWSGLVQAEGSFDGQPVRGTGILQLSGDRHP